MAIHAKCVEFIVKKIDKFAVQEILFILKLQCACWDGWIKLLLVLDVMALKQVLIIITLW